MSHEYRDYRYELDSSIWYWQLSVRHSDIYYSRVCLQENGCYSRISTAAEVTVVVVFVPPGDGYHKRAVCGSTGAPLSHARYCARLRLADADILHLTLL